MSEVADDLNGELSKGLQSMINQQLRTEAIKQDMPNQIAALREAITGDENGKVIVIVDELDRCEPNHALKFLEAMKHVFNQPGYIFCLSVNSVYLEALAKARFAELPEGETYIDKFVDLRFRLPRTNEYIRQATIKLTKNLPKYIPFSDNPAFEIDEAAKLASKLAIDCKFSMRQIRRVLLAVETAIGMHHYISIDCPLLILIAFSDAYDRLPLNPAAKKPLDFALYLPRSTFTPKQLNYDISPLKGSPNGLLTIDRRYRETLSKFNKKYGMLIDHELTAHVRNDPNVENLTQIAKTYLNDHKAMLLLASKMTVS